MHRIPKGHDSGRGLTIFLQFHNCEVEMHADVDRWGAPSECHQLVQSGSHERARLMRRRVKAATGLKWSEFCREVRRRTGVRWMVYRYGTYP